MKIFETILANIPGQAAEQFLQTGGFDEAKLLAIKIRQFDDLWHAIGESL